MKSKSKTPLSSLYAQTLTSATDGADTPLSTSFNPLSLSLSLKFSIAISYLTSLHRSAPTRTTGVAVVFGKIDFRPSQSQGQAYRPISRYDLFLFLSFSLFFLLFTSLVNRRLIETGVVYDICPNCQTLANLYLCGEYFRKFPVYPCKLCRLANFQLHKGLSLLL